MNKVFATSGFCTIFLLLSSSVLSQEKADGWDIEVTPRFWYMILNPTPFDDSTFAQQTNETAAFPLYGLSLKIKPPGFQNSDFIFTGFRGTDVVKGRIVTASGATSRLSTDAIRTDIELLYRTRVSDSDVHWFVGARWAFFDEEAESEPGFAFLASGTNRLDQESNFYLGEIGVSFSTPLDRRKKHVLFGNFMTGIGYETQEVTNRSSNALPDDHSGFIPFLDANIGYQYVISPSMNVHLRYRSFVLRELKRAEFMALHGPEVGMTFRF